MKRFTRISNFQPLARAVMVISAVAVLTTGVTFAALQSQQASLTGNTIQTASADLRIGTSATSFANSRSGFTFGSVIPGSTPVPADGNTFYLKNYGTANLTLKVSVGTTPTNVDGVDLNQVFVVLTRVDTGASQNLSLSSLIASNTTGGATLTDTLAGNTIAQYKVQVSMGADAFSGQSAEIGGIDIVFTGAALVAQ